MNPSFWAICTFFACVWVASGSYLGYPRINFAGHYRVDANTRNNIKCNFRLNYSLSKDLNDDWGFNGSMEFEWFEAKVTTVTLQDGSQSQNDTVIGQNIIGNLKRPYAKLTDLDVDAQYRSTIYGKKFGITSNVSAPEDNLRFFGNWTPSIIAQNMWNRVKCYNQTFHGDELFQDTFPLGASSTTIIDNIDWTDVGDSVALQQLKAASDAAGGKLHVRVTLYYYTRNLPSYVAINATLGYVAGSISVPSPTDTQTIPGQRIMQSTTKIPVGMTFAENDQCNKPGLDLSYFNNWLSSAQFEVDSTRKEVRVDLSNSLPTDYNNTIRNIGNLQLGIYSDSGQCVELIGDEQYIPYRSENWMENEGGIYKADLSDTQVQLLTNSKLVVAQVIAGSGGSSKICGSFLGGGESHTLEILLEETPYFARPADYYVGRLSTGDVVTKTFYVTHFGQPANNVSLRLGDENQALPLNGVQPDSYEKPTNSSGYVSFDFSISGTIPYPREYQRVIDGKFSPGPCKDDPTNYFLPIDGQVYYFNYSVCPSTDKCLDFENYYSPVILAFSNFTFNKPYNWVDDVQPILAQFAQIAHVMSHILDLGNYYDVIKPRNKELLRMSMSLPFDHPGHMPTTRDLSPVKRAMILDWLSDEDPPRYDSAGNPAPPEVPEMCVPPADHKQRLKPSISYFDPPRCANELLFNRHPSALEPFFNKISNIYGPISYMNKEIHQDKFNDRPLIGFRRAIVDQRNHVLSPSEDPPEKICNVSSLQQQLQTAIELEYATLPVYLTTMYSIAEGCNKQQYDLLRTVIMQEMLHMTQAANTLIALGGSPLIDSPDAIAQYPTNLPGGVLPGLTVTLEKMSLQHMYDVLMAIEIPQHADELDPPINNDLFTIGAFYDEIAGCIDYLTNQSQGENIFDPSTASKQVKWPWNPSAELGDVVIVTNTSTALEGIDMIVSQGEGADPLTPYDIENNSLAHFFKFEEIVCQNRINQTGVDKYAYNGPPIPFNPDGVWNMRNNPTSSDIDKNTNCYTEAKAFHGAFRNLLRALQEIFNGSPEKIDTAVEIMESLQIHSKKTMWTKYKPNSIEMCGPVWDYEWAAD